MKMTWVILSMCACSLAVIGCDSSRRMAPDSRAGEKSGPVDVAEDDGDESGGNAVFDVEWQWVRTVTPVEEIDAREPDRYTVIFRPEGRAEMLFDCNRGQGSYTIEGNKLTLGPLIATRMACPDDTQDFVYMDFLQRVTSFFMRDDGLYLELPMDSGTMHFQRAGAEPAPTHP
jgi:heat shock protein HslJ